MAQSNYEQLKQHAADHRSLTGSIRQVLDAHSCGDDRVYRMFRSIEYWMRAHVEEHDSQLIRHLAERPHIRPTGLAD